MENLTDEQQQKQKEELLKAQISENYYDEGLRRSYSELLLSQGRVEDARRILFIPKKASRPVSLVTADTRKTVTSTPFTSNLINNYIELFPESFIYIKPIFNSKLLDEKVLVKYVDKEVGKKITLQSSGIESHSDCLLSSNGGFVFDNIFFAKDNRLSTQAYVKNIAFDPEIGWHYDLENKPQEINSYCFIVQHHPMLNYYHFIIEQAPNLLLYREYLNRNQSPINLFIIENKFKDLFSQVSELLSVADNFLVKSGSFFKFKSVCRPTYSDVSITNGNTFLSSKVSHFSKFMRDSVKSTVQHRKIYISRGDANNKRGVLNEEDVVGFLRRRGFAVYTLDGMELIEQIKLFKECKVVVGAHGAGLTNTIFCEPGTHVVELTNTHTLNRLRIFWDIASMNDLEFSVVSSESMHDDFSASFSVDLEELEKTIDLIERNCT